LDEWNPPFQGVVTEDTDATFATNIEKITDFLNNVTINIYQLKASFTKNDFQENITLNPGPEDNNIDTKIQDLLQPVNLLQPSTSTGGETTSWKSQTTHDSMDLRLDAHEPILMERLKNNLHLFWMRKVMFI